ncbi:MAG: DUF4174 domain-containing protein [Deltaproteobacteria bacterium]
MTLIRIILAAFALTVATGSFAAGEGPVYAPITISDQTLEDYKFESKLLIIFADSPEDPDYQKQIALLDEDLPALERRGVVILTDSDPAAKSAIRLELRPRGFGLVLIGLEGRIQLRKPTPWDVREITRSIDKAG